MKPPIIKGTSYTEGVGQRMQNKEMEIIMNERKTALLTAFFTTFLERWQVLFFPLNFSGSGKWKNT